MIVKNPIAILSEVYEVVEKPLTAVVVQLGHDWFQILDVGGDGQVIVVCVL